MLNYYIFLFLVLFIFPEPPGILSSNEKIIPPPGMVKIPGGTHILFLESEKAEELPVKSFYLDITAVTNAQYLEFVKENPKWRKSSIPGIYGDQGYLKHWKDDLDIGLHFDELKDSPVTNISWHAANAYAKWKGKRLPTALEWEYAARAGIVEDKRPLEEVILEWYSKPTAEKLPAVRSTFKNEYGVYDLHGLIWEWVYDFNSIVMDSDSRSNLAGDRNLFCASGSFGVANKEDYASFMRFAFRGSLKSKYTVSNLGFRCAMDADYSN